MRIPFFTINYLVDIRFENVDVSNSKFLRVVTLQLLIYLYLFALYTNK